MQICMGAFLYVKYLSNGSLHFTWKRNLLDAPQIKGAWKWSFAAPQKYEKVRGISADLCFILPANNSQRIEADRKGCHSLKAITMNRAPRGKAINAQGLIKKPINRPAKAPIPPEMNMNSFMLNMSGIFPPHHLGTKKELATSSAPTQIIVLVMGVP